MNHPPPAPPPRHPFARLLTPALMMLGAAVARAEPAARTVPLCLTEFPPYVSAELPDGGNLGALARRAFNAGGLGVQVLQVPWARAFLLAKNGDCVLLTLWRNEERDALFRYSLPVARMQLGFFVRTDRKTALPPDAAVAFQRGSYLPPDLANGSYRLHELTDFRPGIEMLRLGRVDAVFSERASLEYLLERQPRLSKLLRWQAPPLEVKTTFMAISKNHPQADAWLELLNQEIRASVKN